MAGRYQFERFEISADSRQLLLDGVVQSVGARAFDMLLCLVEHSNRVVSKDELLELIWPGLVVTENNLSVHVSTLRKLLGVQAVLNVPGRGYQFALAVQELAAPPTPSATLPSTTMLRGTAEVHVGDRRQKRWGEELHNAEIDLPLPDKPSIAVLPFLNLSSDPQQDYFADGISEDITTELSRFNALFVIARNSAFTYKGRAVDVRAVARELGVRYLLEGSVRRADQRVRVTAQLIDAATGHHIWAEKYDRVLEDVFAMQEEVTQNIVGAIAPQIHSAEQNMAQRVRPGNLKAHDLAMRANANSNDAIRRNDPVLWQQALGEARAAVAMDPSSVLALTVIAELNARYIGTPQFDEQDLSVPWKEGVTAAGQAIDLDPITSPAYRWMGLLLGFGGFYDEGRAMARRGVELNPNDAIAWSNLAFVEVWSGHPEEALTHQAQAVRLSPRDPNQYLFNICRSLAYFEMKDYAQAMVYARMATGAAPNSPGPQVVLAIAAVGAGELALAKSAHAFFSQLCPSYTKRVMSGDTTFGNPEHRRRAILALSIAAGLQDAGAAVGLR